MGAIGCQIESDLSDPSAHDSSVLDASKDKETIADDWEIESRPVAALHG